MVSTFFVELNCESDAVHGTCMSHHELQKKSACRGPPSSSSRTRLPHTGSYLRTLLPLFATFFLCSSIVGTASATNGRPALPALHVKDRLAWMGSPLYVDVRPSPAVPLLMPPLQKHEEPINTASALLAKRAVKADSKDNSFAIPEPFDTGFSNNFTTTCASFLTRLRTNGDFKKCRPFSLMLQVRRLRHCSRWDDYTNLC